jgi:hypothetical protein
VLPEMPEEEAALIGQGGEGPPCPSRTSSGLPTSSSSSFCYQIIS